MFQLVLCWYRTSSPHVSWASFFLILWKLFHDYSSFERCFRLLQHSVVLATLVNDSGRSLGGGRREGEGRTMRLCGTLSWFKPVSFVFLVLLTMPGDSLGTGRYSVVVHHSHCWYHRWTQLAYSIIHRYWKAIGLALQWCWPHPMKYSNRIKYSKLTEAPK